MVWRLGRLEAEIGRRGGKSGRYRITPWDATFAGGLAVACLLSYEAVTLLVVDFVSRANDYLGGMWAVVATIFVFRNAGDGGVSAGLARFVATCASFLLCFLYLLIFPFTVVGMACLIAMGVLLLAFVSQRNDIVTTGITTAVVMVVAGLDPHDAWQQPLLRLLDTIVGVAIGIACKWLVLMLFFRFSGGVPIESAPESISGTEA